MPDSALESALAHARSLHRASRLAEAEAAYQAILARDPAHARTLLHFSTLAAQTRRLDLAADLCRRAIAADPTAAEFHNELGKVLVQLGRSGEALAEFQKCLDLAPHFAEAHNNLGNVLRHGGRTDEAMTAYRRAFTLMPGYPEAHYNLANTLRDASQLDQAIAEYRRAIASRPNFVEACNNLALVLIQRQDWKDAAAILQRAVELRPNSLPMLLRLAQALRELERDSEAVEVCRRAVALEPGNSEATLALGNALWRNRQFDEALTVFNSIVSHDPGDAAALTSLGALLGEMGQLDAAMSTLASAIELRPDFPEALRNYAVALCDFNRFDEALDYYQRALKSKPDCPQARYGISLVRLVRGDFESGWKDYQQRLLLPGKERQHPQREWKGQPWEGRTIVLLDEGGLGDAIHFIRYAPLVAARGANVIIVCNPKLARLMAMLPGNAQIVPRGQRVMHYDFHIPVGTLPLAFNTRLDTIPAEVPYIRPAAAEVERWRDKLSPVPGLRVGLAWAGNPLHKRDRYRSIPPALLAPLAAAGVTFINLQKPPIAPYAAGLPPFPLVDYTSELNDLADTAALMANLDLVITPDTALAHLAGAMARPVWTFIPFAPDWRWLLDRDDSPWYPTMRLFRQTTREDWSLPIAQAAAELPRQRRGN